MQIPFAHACVCKGILPRGCRAVCNSEDGPPPHAFTHCRARATSSRWARVKNSNLSCPRSMLEMVEGAAAVGRVAEAEAVAEAAPTPMHTRRKSRSRRVSKMFCRPQNSLPCASCDHGAREMEGKAVVGAESLSRFLLRVRMRGGGVGVLVCVHVGVCTCAWSEGELQTPERERERERVRERERERETQGQGERVSLCGIKANEISARDLHPG